jgi:GntR family transcriptional regulator
MVTDREVRRVVELGRIDRSSAIPLYHQLEYLLRRDIEQGRYRPGDPLPSEGEICSTYEVSRSVVRQTLTNLTHAGLVRTERGRGSFVAETKLHERFVQRTTGLYDDLLRMGYDIRTHVLRQAVTELLLPVQEFLQTGQGIQIDRIRSVDGRVITFIRSFVPVSRCPGLERAELEDRSLYQVLADDYGLRVASGRRTVEAVAAHDEVAKQLGVEEGEPVLLLRSASRDERGEPLEWFEAWHRGDRTMFEIEVVAGEADQPVSSVVRPRAGGTRSGAVDEEPEPPEGTGVVDAIARSRVLAVMRAARYRDPAAVVRTLAAHGLRVVEVAIGDDGGLSAIEQARTVAGVVVGAGTVTTAAQARAAIDAGAEFLVAPLGAHEVLAAARSTPVLLAGYTLHEAWAAWQATAAPVMIFPASVGGPGYVAALHGQLPEVPLLPAGGVAPELVVDYLAAGALAVAIGEPLCPTDALSTGDVDVIAERAAWLRKLLDRSPPDT